MKLIKLHTVKLNSNCHVSRVKRRGKMRQNCLPMELENVFKTLDRNRQAININSQSS